MKKICVVTGTRAEYGLLYWVMRGIQDSSELDLQIIVTGMHLSYEFGNTYKEIEKDGFYINKKIDMLLSSDEDSAIVKSVGLGMFGFADSLKSLNPDMILVLGDRFEILSASIAAMILRIPIIHIHGGESTEGLIDEPIRHSITKMSHLHFVSTESYRKRVIQLGEDPKRVFFVGAVGIDYINKINFLSLSELENSLNFKLGLKNILVTFHPVTLDDKTAGNQIDELLFALEEIKDTKIIFTMPNADTDGRIIINKINNFVNKNNNSISFISLGPLRYLSCLKYIDAIVGNSSSGIIEAPSFKIGTINIGDRQRGRIKANSVIDCKPNKESILKAFKILESKKFQAKLSNIINPYGDGGASEKIIKVIEKISLDNIIKKKFYNIN